MYLTLQNDDMNSGTLPRLGKKIYGPYKAGGAKMGVKMGKNVPISL